MKTTHEHKVLGCSSTVFPMLALAWFFHGADVARRQQGRILDRLGYGPVTSPRRTVGTSRSLQLIAYQDARESQPVVLIVPAPIKNAYIWDLRPNVSAVQRFCEAGLQVYMIVWRKPSDGDMGLAEYADNAIGGCLDAVRAETGELKVLLAGHSLGGTLAAIFTSLYPDRVHALIELEGPMEFGSGRLEAAVASAPRGEPITAPLRNMPGTLLDWLSFQADPVTFNGEPLLDWLATWDSPSNQGMHWQVRRWLLDESPMARLLFEEVTNLLYRENRFAEGRLDIAGQVALPAAIAVPILGVLDPRSRIVPPSSIEAYRSRTSSGAVQILHYEGDRGVVMQHLGVLVGRNAHDLLWPQISDWIRGSVDMPLKRSKCNSTGFNRTAMALERVSNGRPATA